MQKLTEKSTIVTDYGKSRTIFDTQNDAYENYYNHSEHVGADETNLTFKETSLILMKLSN
jgi:hypothetical protein